ncbi:hypothetical protein HJG60_012084 [Phyllostomus discolor]|uniref:Secreted protein n=1 Tax=Phyllostomus discolor TaxID=89673 RepID=A0A833ZDS3_9CHIR|nr:hypothetical protein HJG60_012084 [Phyllostomus discolor]
MCCGHLLPCFLLLVQDEISLNRVCLLIRIVEGSHDPGPSTWSNHAILEFSRLLRVTFKSLPCSFYPPHHHSLHRFCPALQSLKHLHVLGSHLLWLLPAGLLPSLTCLQSAWSRVAPSAAHPGLPWLPLHTRSFCWKGAWVVVELPWLSSLHGDLRAGSILSSPPHCWIRYTARPDKW